MRGHVSFGCRARSCSCGRRGWGLLSVYPRGWEAAVGKTGPAELQGIGVCPRFRSSSVWRCRLFDFSEVPYAPLCGSPVCLAEEHIMMPYDVSMCVSPLQHM